jgi:hypothetical protein
MTSDASPASAPDRDVAPAHLRPVRARASVRVMGRRAVVPATLLAAVGASAAASASLAEPPPSAMEAQLEAEIDGMIEEGVSAASPKVEMLEEQLDEVEGGAGEPAAREPGVDTGARLDEADDVTEAQAQAEAARPAGVPPSGGDVDEGLVEEDEARWESGTVECEPVPAMLTIDEVAGATCLSVPQPDGTSRYVAIGPDGTVRSVRFGTDGAVQRLRDSALPAPPRDATVAATAAGDLRVTAPGRAPTTVDLR